MWNTQTERVVSVPGPVGSTTTLQLNAPIVIERSGITVGGSAPMPKLVRYDPALVLNTNNVPTPGCQHLMEIGANVSNLIIEKFEFEGSAGAYAGHCKGSNSVEAQPSAEDLAFKGQNSNVTIRDSEFRNAISRALLIYASNINGVTITGTRFVEPNLVGILVGNNFVWDGGQPPNMVPQHPFCDALSGGLPAAAVADVPRNIVISWNIFLRSWTGAVALNHSRQVNVQYNLFTDNYQRPYDAGGGTMNTTECDYDTKILENVFNVSGLNLPVCKGTVALELNGIKEDVQGNTMKGYPSAVVIARNSKDLRITGNQMEDNGRTIIDTFVYAGIELWNQYKFRAATGIVIENNTITNPSSPPPTTGTLAYGVRLSRHTCEPPLVPDSTVLPCGQDTNQDLIYNVRIMGNTLTNMSMAPYCITSGTQTSTPPWTLQAGGVTCN